MAQEKFELLKSVIDKLWEADTEKLPALKRHAVRFARLIWVAVRDIAEVELTLRAMSLVYTTLLSMVPLLAVSFSVLKAFGVQQQIEPLLLEFLAPLGEKGVEVSNNIISFVDNMNVGVLGSVGLALLFYTVISLISKIEDAFNHIWHIQAARSFMQRFSYYLSVLLIGPVLVFSALGMTATMSSATIVQSLSEMEPFGTLFYLIGITAPYLLTIIAFAFIYLFLPNTRVHFIPALTGAIAAGLLWKTAGWGFANFVAGSTKYNAVYSSFAILIFFMIWIYLSWLIFLVGAQISFLVQKPEFIRRGKFRQSLNNVAREKVALAIMYHVGKQYLTGERAMNEEALSYALNVPSQWIGQMIYALENNSLLVETNTDPQSYVPARDLETITLFDVLKAARSYLDRDAKHTDLILNCAPAESIEQKIELSLERSFGDTNLKQWIKPESAG